ncbi:MAG TPA: hypothetical protein VFW70_18600 [Methylomirabilota bacterium]|nr:hypothetical protein [Methylomirabilota bacterium]
MEAFAGAVIATAPFALVFGLLAWADRRDRRRRDLEARQIALTDAIHDRLGAAAAPVLRRTHGGWQVRLAVPFDRPLMTQALVAVVWDALAADRDGRAREIVLTRQRRTYVRARWQPAMAGGGVKSCT